MTNSRAQKIQQYFETAISVHRAMRSGKESLLKKSGLKRAQFELFFLIARNGKLSVKEIAGLLNVTSSAATQMIDSLVKHGFVERKPDEKDRRVVIVQFSAKGKEQFTRFKMEHLERINKILSVISDQEMDQLLIITDKIVENLKKHSNY